MAQILPVILAGGTGTRLWPLSRAAYPKQFLNLIGKGSLLQQTVQRAQAVSEQPPLVIGLEEHRFIIADQLAEIEVADAPMVLEPTGRNTAIAVALAALWAEANMPHAILLVLPADHYIPDHVAFAAAASQAAELASQGFLTTFGITPHQPTSNYGYIQLGENLNAHGYRVAKFHEKPASDIAMQYLAAGGWYWNSGMFAFNAKQVLLEMGQHAPQVLAAAQAAWGGQQASKYFMQLPADVYANAPNISIDYALMESTENAAILPVNLVWSDVGLWQSLHALQQNGDAAANSMYGPVTAVDSTNCQLHSTGPHVAALGVQDLTVVATADSVLVMSHDAAKGWGELREQLKLDAPELLQGQRQNHRPWGSYQVLHRGEDFLVKEIIVRPSQRLSLQRHKHRAEHWVVVQGVARITCDDWVRELGPNMSVYIPVGAVHRMENVGAGPLHLIEVQSGSYIGEDDIERLEDDFGRMAASS